MNNMNDSFWLVKTADKKANIKGAAYLDMVLCNRDGEINGKLWDYSELAHGTYQAGDLVKVRGSITQFNGNDQLRIDKIRLVNENDGVNVADFVPTAEYSGEMMYGQIMNIIASVKDEDLKQLTYALVKENEDKLLFWPAAFKLHHAIRSGLMMHVLSIVRLAQRVAEVYPFIDRDLLLAGAMLHDIAKTKEYEMTPSGLASGYTARGNLLGHLTMGAIMIEEKAKALGIDSEVVMLLQHMVLSHHGEPEFGAAVRPSFIEAELLSQLDMMDARMFEMREATAGAEKFDFSGRLWSMDNRKLYNHGREDFDKETKLF